MLLVLTQTQLANYLLPRFVYIVSLGFILLLLFTLLTIINMEKYLHTLLQGHSPKWVSTYFNLFILIIIAVLIIFTPSKSELLNMM